MMSEGEKDRAGADIKLNIGCGRDIREGWVNCDLFPGEGVAVVLDASKRLPFQDASVRMSHVMEHIINWEDLVYECHRILVPGGTLEIVVPYGVTFNPFHVRFFMPDTLDVFCVRTRRGIACSVITPNTSFS